MKKLLVLFTLTAALTASAVFAAAPPTPAPVPDPASLIASGQNEQATKLQAAQKRLTSAKDQHAKAILNKSTANGDLSRLQGELKTAQGKVTALQTIITAKLPAELAKLKTAADGEEMWRNKLRDSKVASPALPAVVVADVMRKFEEAQAKLAKAKEVFAAFVNGVNKEVGAAIPEVPDPLVVDTKFADALAVLQQKVTELSGKVTEAQAKANGTAAALATATSELNAAGAEVDRLTAAAGPSAVLQRMGQPVVLPDPVTQQIDETKTAVSALKIPTAEEIAAKVKVPTAEEIAAKVQVPTAEEIAAKVQVPTAEEIAAKVKVPTAEEIAAKVTLPGSMKLDDAQLQTIVQSIEALKTALVTNEGLDAALKALQTNLGAKVYEEDAGTDRCGQRWVRYFILDKNQKKYYVCGYSK